MKKIIGLILLVTVMASGCASTTYLVERDKWPAFNTIIVEDVKVAEGVDMPVDAVTELNRLLFDKLKEDFGGKYRIVRNIKSNEDTMLISIVVVKWYKIFNEMAMEITCSIEKKQVFKIYSPLAVGLMYSKNYLLNGASMWASRRLKGVLEN